MWSFSRLTRRSCATPMLAAVQHHYESCERYEVRRLIPCAHQGVGWKWRGGTHSRYAVMMQTECCGPKLEHASQPSFHPLPFQTPASQAVGHADAGLDVWQSCFGCRHSPCDPLLHASRGCVQGFASCRHCDSPRRCERGCVAAAAVGGAMHWRQQTLCGDGHVIESVGAGQAEPEDALSAGCAWLAGARLHHFRHCHHHHRSRRQSLAGATAVVPEAVVVHVLVHARVSAAISDACRRSLLPQQPLRHASASVRRPWI